MKKIIAILAFSVCFLVSYGQNYQDLINDGNYTVEYISQIAEEHFDSIGRGKGTGYKQFRRWQYFAERAMDDSGKLKSPEFYYNELRNYNSQINSEGVAKMTEVGAWEDMGPTYWDATSGWNPGVGRITSIAIEEGNQNHIIIGGETGGVWKTLDGGATWTVLTDNLSNIDVYALAIDPSNNNTYYWGSTGGTIFKSIDGGSTWNFQGSVSGGTVNKIMIDPTNSNKVYASAQGNGLYKSTNGGSSWSSIYFAGTGSGFDFEFKPGDPNTIYASSSSFYVSTNGGTSFSPVNGTGGNQFGGGPKMIGVSAANPNVVYVVEASGGAFGGLYKSTNSGASFTKLNHDGRNYFGYSSNSLDPGDAGVGQAPRDMDIVVNPNDADDVHIAGINTWRSTNGGLNFGITSQWVPGNASNANIGYCHADVDILLFSGTGANAKLYAGTDGGIFRADNPTVVNSNYYTDLTTGLGIRQFYRIGISQTDPVVVTGGSQDNGSSVLREDGLWKDWLGADGMEGFIDKNNPSRMFGTSQFGSLYSTEFNFLGSNGVNFLNGPDGKGGTFQWNWIVPFEQDPLVQNTIYVAFDEVYKSLNGGFNWSSISPNINANIDHFKIAPSNNQYMYMANNGTFRFSTNGGATWNFSSLNLGGNFINSIAVHPTDPAKLAIAVTGSQKVYTSTDNGVSWTAIPWDLPNFSAQAVVWQDNGKDGLYVGMNYGVYYTDTDLGNSWTAFNNGLPNVRINELEINTADGKIYAGTYGRGLWRSDLYQESLSLDEFGLSDFSLYPNPANNEINVRWDKSDGVSVRIYNSLGKLMFYGKDLSLINGYKIDMTSFESGVYFVKLSSELGEVTKKLILK
ncbi:MAG: T9SS type A sorting domain-containing protein [Winogradskyella sp.]|uniref:T9SS type A sorting domain-containing protein n=1 Tax=Winogradskyella sp. TaxID=1883156 RepID=UPI0025DDFC94|nr:T9SS type A sorting domain-containing protein [Winogradskyella sp.]NRB58821.1 T9SS type A sorting domain-containing protein [Winogradskyella sp.]